MPITLKSENIEFTFSLKQGSLVIYWRNRERSDRATWGTGRVWQRPSDKGHPVQIYHLHPVYRGNAQVVGESLQQHVLNEFLGRFSPYLAEIREHLKEGES